ncbi:regulatory LuxR family protein [Tamaricihabitans halophyticus]|uniref:Regulatory LuxR family protein n=1 Tax=Tamaricihabitans halophyticus TaxID=1262583 RepID=A0A4R2R227_9PSEU|nr:AAA family ATPase [Tamaricihabitans halophyticus]TCP53475.1 regulatory LuxR family protein [Tamaricihabitans halophyticus]
MSPAATLLRTERAIVDQVSEPRRLIGRDKELTGLVNAIDEGCTRAGGIILLSGEAGIGKSALLATGVREIRNRRWQVYTLGCDEIARRTPVGALCLALRRAKFPSAKLAALAGDVAAAGEAPGGRQDGELFVPVLRFFDALRERVPCVLVADDLELLDFETISLVEAMTRRRAAHPVVLVGGLRVPRANNAGRLGRLLRRLDDAGYLRSIMLDELADDAMAELTELTCQASSRRSVQEAVRRDCGGNPYYALQVIEALGERPESDTAEPSTPESVDGISLSGRRRAAILSLLPELDGVVRSVAQALALLGPAPLARVDLVVRMTGADAADVDTAFDTLVRGRLVEVTDEAYTFRHPILRHALVQELGPARRRRWHQIAAAWIQTLPASAARNLELARHIRHTAEFGDDQAIELLARVAARACQQRLPSSACWLDAAIRLTPRTHQRYPELMAALVRALYLSGRMRDAVERGAPALEDLPRGPDRDRLATTVIEALAAGSTTSRAASILDAECGPGANLIHDAQAGTVYALSGRAQDARKVTKSVVDRVAAASPDDQVKVLGHLAHLYCVTADIPALQRVLTELKSAAERSEGSSQLAAVAVISYVSASLGDTKACSESLRQADQLIVNGGDRHYRNKLTVARVGNAVNLGEWSAAVELIEASSDELATSESLAFLATLTDVAVELHAHRGNWRQVRQAAVRPRPDAVAFDVTLASAMTVADQLTGDYAKARARLRPYLSRTSTPARLRVGLLCRLCEVEVESRQFGAARDTLRELDCYASAGVDRGTSIVGKLCWGQLSGDGEVLRQAYDEADQYGFVFLKGRAQLYLGMIGVDTEANLRQALEVFHALAAVPWRRRVAAEMRVRGLKVPRHRKRGTEPLNPTEAQIARLVQIGRSNLSIAKAMSLSVKTVEANLSRVYARTGFANRMELVRALDAGLLDNG